MKRPEKIDYYAGSEGLLAFNQALQFYCDHLESQLKEREELLELFVDDTDCRFDHNGWCQTHNLTQEENYKCPMEQVRTITSNPK